MNRRCAGTKARYALRCTLNARDGFVTCKRHADQENSVVAEVYRVMWHLGKALEETTDDDVRWQIENIISDLEEMAP